MDATKQGYFFFISCLFLAACGQQNSGKVNTTSFECAPEAREDSFLVKWRDQVPREFQEYQLAPSSRVTRFENTKKETVEKEILQKHLNEYEIAEHEFNLRIHDVHPQANCTNLPLAWGPGDINTSAAWVTLGKQGEDVTVGLVDGGVDINHPLLQDNIWFNAGEVPNNGLDDDRNGYIDDYKGFNFENMTSDVTGDASHGTHVAGIVIGKTVSDGSGFTGIAPKSRLMPLKFIKGDSGSVGNAIKAMEYARRYGAKVINASWGGELCSDVLKDAIINVTQSGTVFTNAAGNFGHDLNRIPEWPAVYQLPGKITVGAYNSSQRLSNFSNYGSLVDLAAPGEAILSTYPQGQMCSLSGTSMATPFVTGVAALLFSKRPSSTPAQIVDAINLSVTLGQYGVRTKGKINALGAAQYLLAH